MNTRPLLGSLAARSAIGAIALVATFADASVFRREDVRSLARASTTVVRAHVRDIRSDWNPDRTMIFSYVTLDVARSFKGRSEPVVTVRVPGGTIGDLTIAMEGAPSFAIGDDVVVFLGEWQDGAPMVAGYFQGLSSVRRDGAGIEMLQGGSAHGMSTATLARRVAEAADRRRP